MMPVVFKIPFVNISVPGFGLMLMLAFLVSIIWAVRRAERSKANPDVILNLGFVALICGVVGCRLMYVVHYWDQFRGQGNLLQTVWSIINISRGGVEFYGGFILTVVVALIWLKGVEKVSLRWYLDISAPSLAMGLAIGRLGCFLNGCCYGSVCDQPWAVRFPYGSPAQVEQWQNKRPGAGIPEQLLFSNGPVLTPISRESMAAKPAEVEAAVHDAETIEKQAVDIRNKMATADAATKTSLQTQLVQLDQRMRSVPFFDVRQTLSQQHMTFADLQALANQHPSLPVHPAQLYSTITALLVAFLLNALYWRRTRDGQIICTLLIIEPITRVLLEIIRDDNPIDVFGALTISQWLAAIMITLGVVGLITLRRMPPRSPITRPWTPPPEAAPATA